ncbi:MAG TPA: hypothetical protein DCS42_03555 [Nitrospiraceae bacterium]|nr:hypothetical protein [Nitrospiraceae bacterium]HAS53260.1 hypothetical protein [Nitrospiraceae bacterium]
MHVHAYSILEHSSLSIGGAFGPPFFLQLKAGDVSARACLTIHNGIGREWSAEIDTEIGRA